MHVKIIKGKKYYYESKRVGKKVISKYIGPVKPLRKKKKELIDGGQAVKQEDVEETKEDDFYIG
jgi:hypothetical protein